MFYIALLTWKCDENYALDLMVSLGPLNRSKV
jgi:hypothetical protein